jgi:hypothetical protein
LPHVYSSLRAVLARGLIPKVGQKEEERRRIKVLRVTIHQFILFGLREEALQAQYALAFFAIH